MKWNNYELSCRNPDDIDGIVNLGRFLWRSGDQANREYLIWKHEKNPYLNEAVSIVARYNGEVVGFLGVVPAEWRIGEKKFMILQGADIVVHPQHQGKWLASAMIRAGFQLLPISEYGFFFTGSPNFRVTPVAVKLGWKKLATRNYLRHVSLLHLTTNKVLGSSEKVLETGRFKDIEVSNDILAVDISRIAANSAYSSNKFALSKSPEFLEWKYQNPKAKFVYLYHLNESRIDAYLIISLTNEHGHIFDYDEEPNSGGIGKLLSFVIRRGRFASISLLNASLPDELRRTLHKKHFYNFELVEKLRHRESYKLPILVRPSPRKYTEDDWFINGIDIRDINNWHITEICCD